MGTPVSELVSKNNYRPAGTPTSILFMQIETLDPYLRPVSISAITTTPTQKHPPNNPISISDDNDVA